MTGRNEAKPEPPKQSNRHRTWQRPTIQTTACHVQKTGRTPGQKQRAEFSETPLSRCSLRHAPSDPRLTPTIRHARAQAATRAAVYHSLMPQLRNTKVHYSTPPRSRPYPAPFDTKRERDILSVSGKTVLLHEHHVQLVLVRLAKEGLAGAVSFEGCLKGCSERRNTSVMISLVAWNVVINDDDFPLFLDTLCKKQS